MFFLQRFGTVHFFSLETLQHWIQHYGYWTIALGILLENAGIPLPGETITLIGGFLAGQGELKYWGVLSVACGGAICGDSIGYWVGATGGWPLFQRLGQFFRFSEAQLESIRQTFSENADRAVFLGRFVALLRIFAGPLAGLSGMPYPRFLIFNAAGATLWATAMVSLSYGLGHIIPLDRLVSWVAQFGVLALLLIVLGGISSWWIHRRPVS